MKLYGPFITVLVLALLLAVPNLLSGHGLSTVMESAAPAEITFESTAPDYQPEVAVVWSGVPIRWINATASPPSIRHDGCVTNRMCAFQSIAVAPIAASASPPCHRNDTSTIVSYIRSCGESILCSIRERNPRASNKPNGKSHELSSMSRPHGVGSVRRLGRYHYLPDVLGVGVCAGRSRF
jgi:hypothetical protein